MNNRGASEINASMATGADMSNELEHDAGQVDPEVQWDVLMDLLDTPGAMEQVLANRSWTGLNTPEAAKTPTKAASHGSGWPVASRDKDG